MQNLYGSKDVTREAFKTGLIENGEVWMAMIKSRNLTSYTYNEDTAAGIVLAILHEYAQEFRTIRAKFQKMRSEAQS